MKPGTIFAVILLNLFVMLFLVFLIAINAPASDFKHTTKLPIFNVEGGYQTLQKKKYLGLVQLFLLNTEINQF